MREFVREHALEFGLVELVDERVEEDDALGRAEPREEGVRVARARTRVHHVDVVAGEAGALEDVVDGLAEARVFDGVEVVEQREEHARHDDLGGEQEDADDAGGGEPPPLGERVHDEQHRGAECGDEHDGERGADELVANEQFGRLLVEVERVLDGERLEGVEGHAERLHRERGADEHRDAREQVVPDGVVGRGDGVPEQAGVENEQDDAEHDDALQLAGGGRQPVVV